MTDFFDSQSLAIYQLMFWNFASTNSPSEGEPSSSVSKTHFRIANMSKYLLSFVPRRAPSTEGGGGRQNNVSNKPGQFFLNPGKRQQQPVGQSMEAQSAIGSRANSRGTKVSSAAERAVPKMSQSASHNNSHGKTKVGGSHKSDSEDEKEEEEDRRNSKGVVSRSGSISKISIGAGRGGGGARASAPSSATHASTSTAVTKAEGGATAKATLCCDKCDGKHLTDDCPHYKKKREEHPDAQKNFYKKMVSLLCITAYEYLCYVFMKHFVIASSSHHHHHHHHHRCLSLSLSFSLSLCCWCVGRHFFSTIS